MEELLYPINNQTFEKIRENGRVYIDKTEFIYKLLKYSDYVFLSRPRRFGKSLLVSTLEAFFKGKRHLFKGLAIDRLMPEEWLEYPVLHLDLSNSDFTDSGVLTNALATFMSRYEEEYGITEKNQDIAKRFEILIRKISSEEDKKVVVLIDEYDSPIVQTMGNGKLQDEMRRILHAFYSTLKTMDAYVRFCMLTGVTKYGKMSIFSGLNNLRDITFLDDYASICGITEEELRTVLTRGVQALADSKGITVDEAYALLKDNYDGYHFSKGMVDVYNPYSLLNALADKEILDYWFETGTPTMLIRLLENLDTDIEALNGSEASIRELSDISTSDFNPLALFYQSGYLTIKGYDPDEDAFILGFPNREVERGFGCLKEPKQYHQVK